MAPAYGDSFNGTKVHPRRKCVNMINPKGYCKRHPDVTFDPAMTKEQWRAIDAPDVYPWEK